MYKLDKKVHFMKKLILTAILGLTPALATPAMAAGIADHVWSVRELLEAA